MLPSSLADLARRRRRSRRELAIAAAGTIALSGWVLAAQVDEAVHGQGAVAPSKRVQVIQSTELGRVAEVLVRPGDRVQAGQTVIRLRYDTAEADRDERGLRSVQLRAKIARLRAELDGRSDIEWPPGLAAQLTDAQRRDAMRQLLDRSSERAHELEALQHDVERAEGELREARSKASNLAPTVKLALEEVEMWRRAARDGNGVETNRLSAEKGYQQVQNEQQGALNSIPRLQAASLAARGRYQQTKTAQMTKVQGELAEANDEQQMTSEREGASDSRIKRGDLSSPIPGIVKSVQVTGANQVAQPGQALAEIVPEDDTMVIEAELQPQDKRGITAGLRAAVRIIGATRAGSIAGFVETISADTFKDPQTGRAFYKASIRTDQPFIDARDGRYTIEPGMPAEVSILTGRRSIASFIFDPLLRSAGRAFSERPS